MNSNTIIHEATSKAEIQKCYDAMKELRPYLEAEDFVRKVQRMFSIGYRLIYIENENGKAIAVAGFRMTELLHWGKAIYIDDLSTMQSERSNGYGSRLLDFIHQLAKENNCGQVHLDSGCKPERYDAHRLYLKKGYNITSHHFAFMVS